MKYGLPILPYTTQTMGIIGTNTRLAVIHRFVYNIETFENEYEGEHLFK